MYSQPINRAQRIALKRVYDRCPLYDAGFQSGNSAAWQNRRLDGTPGHGQGFQPKTYRQFRRTVVRSFDCIMLPWCGMWLGIESDGYTHS